MLHDNTQPWFYAVFSGNASFENRGTCLVFARPNKSIGTLICQSISQEFTLSEINFKQR